MQRQRQIPAIEESTWWLAQGEFVTQILRASLVGCTQDDSRDFGWRVIQWGWR
jgi:hypothetical protein